MAELARIRKERAEEAARKVAEEAAVKQKELQQEVATGNPLLNQAMDFQVRPTPWHMLTSSDQHHGARMQFTVHNHHMEVHLPSWNKSAVHCHVHCQAPEMLPVWSMHWLHQLAWGEKNISM